MFRIAIAATLSIASVATAQISPVSRESRTYAWEHLIDLGGNDLGVISHEETLNTFAPFDSEFQITGFTAIQHSYITDSTVSVHAEAFGLPQSTFGFGGAESTFVLVFNILSQSTYRLEGDTSRFIGEGSVSLAGLGVSDLADVDSMQPVPFLFEGSMSPGQYTMTVRATADFGAANALLTVTEVPTPGVLPMAMMGVALARRRRRQA